MVDSFEEFVRKTKEELLSSLTTEELLNRVPPEGRLKGMSVEELVKGLTPEAKEKLIRQLLTNQSAPKSE